MSRFNRRFREGMALFAVLLFLASCGPRTSKVGADDYIDDADGKRQLTQVEYDALKEFLAAAEVRDASGVSDAADSHIYIDGVRFLIYWHYLCLNDDRTRAYRIGDIKFSHDKNFTADITDVLAWSEKHEP